jgi:hypothetical protein
MTFCNLHSSAQLILGRIDRQKIMEESLDRYERTRAMLQEPFLVE